MQLNDLQVKSLLVEQQEHSYIVHSDFIKQNLYLLIKNEHKQIPQE